MLSRGLALRPLLLPQPFPEPTLQKAAHLLMVKPDVLVATHLSYHHVLTPSLVICKASGEAKSMHHAVIFCS